MWKIQIGGLPRERVKLGHQSTSGSKTTSDNGVNNNDKNLMTLNNSITQKYLPILYLLRERSFHSGQF